MKKFIISLVSSTVVMSALAQDATWISVKDEYTRNTRTAVPHQNANVSGTWSAFRHDFNINKVPEKALARIAVDSKYWLWINGKMAVFEGGLKRGPNPNDTYCDEVDIAPFLKRGKNQIAVLVWFFGKDGFSHRNSGKMGLFFDLKTPEFSVVSDKNWFVRVHPAYSVAGYPNPNFRLSETNILFDANKDIEGWQTVENPEKMGFRKASFLGYEGHAPWNKLVKRPIPFWKDYGVKEAKFRRKQQTDTDLYRSIHRQQVIPIKRKGERDIIIAGVPYNMQLTPIITLTDEVGGSLIDIQTDHSFSASEFNLRAEYITKKGTQTYESLGWLNGERIIINVPRHVKVESVKYRETGYDTKFAGTFSCDNVYYSRFWQKAVRTLYVNMRDNFFDCPERERGQWWGDAVLLMSESFYTLCPSNHALMRKAMRELVDWRNPDGALFSPIPGIFNSELPSQMLASVGRFGFWNYYMNTGDIETLRYVYPAVKDYLSLWKLDETGLTAHRAGGWTWGDWGKNKDIRMIFSAWHYIALEAAANMADVLGKPEDASNYRATMATIKTAYNKLWNGSAYRHPDYKGETDDRPQALAVLAGIADSSKYPAIFKTLQKEFHASPYMEKYVMEALFVMGYPEYALARTQMRFDKMVMDEHHTTLWEGWEIDGFGGGSTNHAWSGGALTILAQYVCGLYPLEPAWKTFKIEPTPAYFGRMAISVPSIAGNVKSSFEYVDNNFKMNVSVPQNTTGILYLPDFANGKDVKINGSSNLSKYAQVGKFAHKTKRSYALPAGEYEVVIFNVK
ncbi:MAG: hypothetical protein J6B07_01125 [Opitutales bacterium]|nr:hypothetical protein [Opitutales bacterium]